VERKIPGRAGVALLRIHIIDTKPDPKQPKIVKVIEPQEVMDRAGYSRLHTLHCAPDGIYVGALGRPRKTVRRHPRPRPRQLQRPRALGKSTAAAALATTSPGLGHDTLIHQRMGTPKMIEAGEP